MPTTRDSDVSHRQISFTHKLDRALPRSSCPRLVTQDVGTETESYPRVGLHAGVELEHRLVCGKRVGVLSPGKLQPSLSSEGGEVVGLTLEQTVDGLVGDVWLATSKVEDNFC